MSTASQIPASQRIAALLDDNSFVEIGGLVRARSTDYNLSSKESPADGVLTGYGTIDGNLVYVYSQDASTLGGTIGEMHSRKITKIYELALMMGAPVIGLIDCAGLRLEESTDALSAFGNLYSCQAAASGIIPQITAIFGTCGGGLAVVPAITDFTFMESTKARLFVNAPNTLEGNKTENTSNAAFASEVSGLVDVTGTEDEIIEEIRSLISILPGNNEDEEAYEECTDDLNRLCEDLEAQSQDTALAAQALSDNGFFFEVERNHAKEMVCGFIRLNARTVGLVGNRTAVFDEEGKETATFEPVITTEGAVKAADFVNFCDAFNIPVLTLTNVTGFKATKEEEKTVARAAGKLIYALQNATVPKINIVTGNANTTAGLVMNSAADMSFAWEDAVIAPMDPTAAVKIIYADEIAASTSKAALIAEKAAAYRENSASALAAARRGYIDSVITAPETRQIVLAAFEMLYTKREDLPSKKHGTV